jgi:hypothetical protein
VGPRVGLDRFGKSRSHRDSIPGPSSPFPVATPTELPGPQLDSILLRKFRATLLCFDLQFVVTFAVLHCIMPVNRDFVRMPDAKPVSLWKPNTPYS